MQSSISSTSYVLSITTSVDHDSSLGVGRNFGIAARGGVEASDFDTAACV